MTYEKVSKLGFELKTCGRCGGCGSYSWCQMHGSTCFGCGGTGYVLTKRGAAAKAFYMQALVKPVADLQVGDWVLESLTLCGPDVWCRIDAIHAPDAKKFGTVNGEPFGSVQYSRKGKEASHGFTPATTFRSVRNEDERKAAVAAALAYQDTLGVSGKPTKRVAKAVA
jgi:hypothetical protein